MKQNAKNPASGNAAGAGSENQVKFTKVVLVEYCGYTDYREIKSRNRQAFEAALKRTLNASRADKDIIQEVLRRILENNSKPWEKIEPFGVSYGGETSVSVRICDAVKVSSSPYVYVKF